MRPGGPRLGVYLHFPFCAERCTYCDFATVAGRDESIDSYLAAIEEEIARASPTLGEVADSVYVGGGTPSKMRPDQLARLLAAVRRRFRLEEGAEVTIEANPESVTAPTLEGYLEAGVNRISVGVQSLDDAVLRRVGRAHDARRAAEAVRIARASGVAHASLDLIAGLPGEVLANWGETVRRAAALEPDHLSVYLLETDKEAPLARSVRAGRTRIADEDAMAAAYETTAVVLEAEGFVQYEISNWSLPGHEGRHNLKYWTDAPFVGFGVAAHSYVAGERRANRRDLDGYVAAAISGAETVDWVDPREPIRRAGEALVMGLRLVVGVDLAPLGERYGLDLLARHASAWERARAAGILEASGTRVRLTPRGRLRSNELFVELI